MEAQPESHTQNPPEDPNYSDPDGPFGPPRAVRTDGWTPERIQIFLETLASSGSVTQAAYAAGMSRQSAYALRYRPQGRAFPLAWDAAVRASRTSLTDALLRRAIEGQVETWWRDGRPVERHRFDNRLAMALLARLDRQKETSDFDDRTVEVVAENFADFVPIASAGGEGAAAFIAARRPGWPEQRDHYTLHGRPAEAEDRDDDEERGEDEERDNDEELADEEDEIAAKLARLGGLLNGADLRTRARRR